jgi:hypothetical protein
MRPAFEVQTQQRLNWCWAAVAAAVQDYLSPESAMSQCQVAQQLHKTGDKACCDDPKSPCNTPQKIQDALRAVGIKCKDLPVSLTFDRIKEQIDRGHPVCVRILWSDGGGHFVVIHGYREAPGVQQLFVSDPYFIDSLIEYDEFLISYQNHGEWVASVVLEE